VDWQAIDKSAVEKYGGKTQKIWILFGKLLKQLRMVKKLKKIQ